MTTLDFESLAEKKILTCVTAFINLQAPDTGESNKYLVQTDTLNKRTTPGSKRTKIYGKNSKERKPSKSQWRKKAQGKKL